MDYKKRIIKSGQIALVLCIIANFIPGIYLWIAHGIMPTLQDLLQLWLLAAGAFGVSWVVQPIAYFGAIGTAGTYLSWVVGSVVDIRLPAALMAQKMAGVDPNSEEGEVISTLAIAVSVFVSVGMITLFTIIGVQIIPYFPPFITGSFNYILPALFGAVYINLAKRNMRMGIGTLVVAIIILIAMSFTSIPGALVNLLVVILGMVVARIVYVSDRNKQQG